MPALPLQDQPSHPVSLPTRRHKFPTPKLRLHLNELSHEGSSIFLTNVKGNEDIETQVQNVLNLLYLPSSERPGTRSVTLILRHSGGVAYTTGTDLDNDHKEIHFDLGYISQISSGQRDEILGVICHELVHCFQWNAEGTAPGGLIEGIADWVRLRAGLSAKHWKRDAEGDWDGGYQKTGYFLQYLEERFGDGTVRTVNARLRKGKYDEEKLFGECCQGHKIGELWEDYREYLSKGEEEEEGGKSG